MSDENPTWDDDIEGFFTQLDIGCMRNVAGFDPPLDLSDYESVKKNATRIHGAVSAGRMPKGDRPWAPEKVAVFKKWIDIGAPKEATP
ncbi:MAG: hypothetical protein AABO57_24700 [Acidobacteriota bacterium]